MFQPGSQAQILEVLKKRRLTVALDRVTADFDELDGMIIDIRNNPGGDDSTVLQIVNRLCDRKRVAFHRRTKIGPGEDDFENLKTWFMKPQGKAQFTNLPTWSATRAKVCRSTSKCSTRRPTSKTVTIR